MLRYRLDDLGWFHFEKLVQSLLKADLGLSVESWGGHGDLGRDAYARTRLRFPDRSVQADGPFLFQAKFVQGANAAGANWSPSLLKAISGESSRIRERNRRRKWSDPAHYVLLTNCPLTARSRESVMAELTSELPNTEITSLGGSDICDLLDVHPKLRQTFPEILSLRDLDALLAQAVNRGIIERSRVAIAEARDLVPVFVPTGAYYTARRRLGKHFFVVLDGPPEMGKTAIARTIALTYLLSSWQVVECRDPGDFFDSYRDDSQQVFVADDAFGRTEYDPHLGRMWERDLSRVLRRLDAKHRLIWTTRKHILMRARREMDLAGDSARFPAPGEVIVTADKLSIEEKARILYRHCRAARLGEQQRQIVRANASSIVKNSHFTPERIRRLVTELLPKDDNQGDSVARSIAAALRNPTERMRKSFRKLPAGHVWVLTALLECQRSVPVTQLQARFAALFPGASERLFFESLDDLTGTFIKGVSGGEHGEGPQIDWVHPSYRDLVVDELASSPTNQAIFLGKMSISGVKLALSVSGGSLGERQMPLMTTPESWASLAARCREIVSTASIGGVAQLIDALASASRVEGIDEKARASLKTLLQEVYERGVVRWDECTEALSVMDLESFLRARTSLSTTARLPDVGSIWESYSSSVREAIAEGESLDPYEVDGWTDLVITIERHFPAFRESEAFRAARGNIETELFSIAGNVVNRGADPSNWSRNDSEGRRLGQFGEVLERLDRDGRRGKVISEVYSLAQEYADNAPSEEPPDDYDFEEQEPAREFDVEALFVDL